MFRKFSSVVSRLIAHPYTFVTVLLLLTVALFYAGTDPARQMYVNTAISVFTLLIMFPQAGAQQRNDEATHGKLDGLIHGVPEADNSLAGSEKD